MSNRIDDRNEERRIREMRQKEKQLAVDKVKQKQFEQKLNVDIKKAQADAPRKSIGKEVIQKSKESKEGPATTAPRESTRSKPRGAIADDKRTDRKEETKQSQKEAIKRDEVREQAREDLLTQNAVKRKSEQDKDADSQGGDAEGDAFFQRAISMGSPHIEETKSTGPSHALSNQDVQRLVDHISLVTTKAGQEMQIELQKDVLGGARIGVRVQQGKVYVRFEGLSAQFKAAVKNAQPSIAKGLAQRNLELGDISFAL